MVSTRDFAVATASQLLDGTPSSSGPQYLDIRTQQYESKILGSHQSKGTPQLKRSSAVRKSVRFVPSAIGGSEKDNSSPEDLVDTTDTFTQSQHASGVSPEQQLPQGSVTEPSSPELLQPVVYSPIAAGKTDDRVAAALASGIIRSDTVRHKVGVLEYSTRVLPQVPETKSIVTTELHIDTDSHKRNLSNTSSASSSDRPRRKRASSGAKEIYFTPTDVHSSRTCLSSPLNSPTLPRDYAEDDDDDDDDDLPTPRATTSASLTRPPSAIYVGPVAAEPPAESSADVHADERRQIPDQAKPTIRITPEQLDQLVIALARSKLVRRHLQQDWFDPDEVPDDDDSKASSSGTVSAPTLTSASTLYSQQNEHGPPVNNQSRSRSAPENTSRVKLATSATRQSESVVICDPKIYGTPAKYVSTSHNTTTVVGTRTFLMAPGGSEVECSLRLQPASTTQHTNVRVFLQCINQIVDRKSGNRSSLLSAEIDVTAHIAHAAIAELAEGTCLAISDIAVCESPTSPSRASILRSTPNSLDVNRSSSISSSISSSSNNIDYWIAIADDLQHRDHIHTMIDTAVNVFSHLDATTASPSTLTFLRHLTHLADQYHDILILQPTSWHADGVTPHTIKIPYCSRRLYEDWYTDPRGSQAGEKVGESAAARGFQRGIVSAVAKRAGEVEGFRIEGFWEKAGRVRQALRVVPMSGGGGEDKERLWCCFVLGEEDDFFGF